MKNSANSQRGPALGILVLVIAVLVGIAGLAVDGGNVIDGHPRRPQNAADSAALAAALCRVRGQEECVQRAYDVAAMNGYDNDLVSNHVEAYTCDMAQASCGSYAGNPDYIQVIITADRDTFFTKVVGIRQRERVQALALAQQRPAQVGLVHSDNPIPGMEHSWVFSPPPWIRFILQPTALVLLFIFIIGVLMIALPPLLKRRRA